MKRLEQLAASRSEGKKKRTSKKQMMKYLNPGHALTAYYDTEKVKKKGSSMIENRDHMLPTLLYSGLVEPRLYLIVLKRLHKIKNWLQLLLQQDLKVEF